MRRRSGVSDYLSLNAPTSNGIKFKLIEREKIVMLILHPILDRLEWQISQDTANRIVACLANLLLSALFTEFAATGHDKRLFFKDHEMLQPPAATVELELHERGTAFGKVLCTLVP
ncbi:hypothetical protein Nepgr_018227 [Nepenthes gracilis]|uniref:Uncharacterized protein n=1 Tax=Nepenthes gracilis TaxID=150966 RepID=A0AAD3SUD3_NEPGR|nr:hypothetical protein Nepgr_018227 [Nepenthes gracilis]